MAKQAELRIEDLPEAALDAAGAFHTDWTCRIREDLRGEREAFAVILPLASYDHDDWRRAAARDLARAYAPKRVNIVAGDDEAAITATLSYLAGAPGVTGQYLKTHGNSLGDRA